MLSFILGLATSFERKHGVPPNLLYLNTDHFSHLREELGFPSDVKMMNQMLGMEIVIYFEARHPHVAYSGGIREKSTEVQVQNGISAVYH